MVSAAAAAAIRTTAATAAAAIRATDTLFTAFFRFDHIPDRKADDDHKHSNDNNIFHNYLPDRAYSALTFLSDLTHRYTTMAAITATAIRPPTKPAPKEPVVIKVPIW